MIRTLSVKFFLFLILVSCSEKEMETKELSDILPSSEREYITTTSDELSDAEDSSNYFKQRFLAHGILIDDIERLESDAFPDRFNPKFSDRFKIRLDQDSIIYEKWTYSDSSSLLSAFYNWLDCFGEDCISIKPGDERKLVNMPIKLFVNDTTLILVSGDMNNDRWMKYHASLGYEMNWNYVLEQTNFGKTKWSRYIKGERVSLEPIKASDDEDSK